MSWHLVTGLGLVVSATWLLIRLVVSVVSAFGRLRGENAKYKRERMARHELMKALSQGHTSPTQSEIAYPDHDEPNEQGWQAGDWVRYTSSDTKPGVITRTMPYAVWVDWTPVASDLSVAMVPNAFYYTDNPDCPLVRATFAEPGKASPEDIERWLEE